MGRLIDADEVDDAIYKCFEGIQCYEGTGYDIYSDSKESIDKIPTVEAISKADYQARLKADIVAMLKELQYDLYHALCHEIHGKEDCPCTNQTTSCLATFRVCDADRAIGNVIQQKINSLKGQQDGNE